MITTILAIGLAFSAAPADTVPPPGDYQPATQQTIDTAYDEPMPVDSVVTYTNDAPAASSQSAEQCEAYYTTNPQQVVEGCDWWLNATDLCIVDAGGRGTTRWSFQPCVLTSVGDLAVVDIGTPATYVKEPRQQPAVWPTTNTLPVTGARADIAIIAALLVALGLVLVACGRQCDSDKWSDL